VGKERGQGWVWGIGVGRVGIGRRGRGGQEGKGGREGLLPPQEYPPVAAYAYGAMDTASTWLLRQHLRAVLKQKLLSVSSKNFMYSSLVTNAI
jgi:hypothetical protein